MDGMHLCSQSNPLPMAGFKMCEQVWQVESKATGSPPSTTEKNASQPDLLLAEGYGCAEAMNVIWEPHCCSVAQSQPQQKFYKQG